MTENISDNDQSVLIYTKNAEGGAESHSDDFKVIGWTAEEDQTIQDHVKKHGAVKWKRIQLTGRVGGDCKKRWFEHLSKNERDMCIDAKEDHSATNHSDDFEVIGAADMEN